MVRVIQLPYKEFCLWKENKYQPYVLKSIVSKYLNLPLDQIEDVIHDYGLKMKVIIKPDVDVETLKALNFLIDTLEGKDKLRSEISNQIDMIIKTGVNYFDYNNLVDLHEELYQDITLNELKFKQQEVKDIGRKYHIKV